MKKLSVTILLILFIVVSSVTIVNAEDGQSANFSLTTDNVNVKVGDEVTVKVVINNVTGFEGINTFAAKKVFDASIFEYLGCEGQNGWEVKGDVTNIVLKSNSHSSSGVIAILKFKVINSVENTTIQLTNVDACGDDGDVYFEDENVNSPSVSFKVTANSEQQPSDNNGNNNSNGNNDNSNGNNNNSNNNGNNNANNSNNGNNSNATDKDKTTNKTNDDKTTATGNKIPQTGEPYFAIIAIIVGVILAVILYAKYKVCSNKMK